MYVSLLQPRLVPAEIAQNAQEIISRLDHDMRQANTDTPLYVCGCETTIGTSCSALQHLDSVTIEQLRALKKIQRHLGEACMLIGGVQLNLQAEPLRLQHQIFFLTRTSLISLLPLGSYAIGSANRFRIEEERYELAIDVRNWGDYYYLNLRFVAPEKKEFHIYMHARIPVFSPYSLEKVLPLFKRHCKDSVYISNRVGMFNGQLQGGYSVFCPNGRSKKEREIHAPVPDVLGQQEYLKDFPQRTAEFQYRMTVRALKLFFDNAGQKKAILGLSGGIDSALVLVLAAEALGAKNVLGLIMPSQYTADASITSAQQLAKNLGVETKIISITPLTDAYLNTLEPYFAGLPADTTEENLQARVRAVLLMAFSNKFGHILLNTSNKSECAVGYSTMYGDACGAVSVIGALYKTEVYGIARWINREQEIIPHFIIDRPPSAELRPDQTDQDSLPPYDMLDALLVELLDKGKRAERIHLPNVTKETVARVARLVKNAAYKRYQMPPCLRIAPDSFFDK